MVEIFKNITIFAMIIQMLLLFKAGKKYQVIFRVLSELIILVYIMNCFSPFISQFFSIAQISINKLEAAQEFIWDTAQEEELNDEKLSNVKMDHKNEKVKSKMNLEINKINVKLNPIKVHTDQLEITRQEGNN